MNILDENIIASQCERLRAWKISFRRLGHEIGRQGMDDTEEIIPLLHRLPQPTFFTRDADFYQRTLCHPAYCLVVLTVHQDEAAHYIRGFLKHPGFNTRAKRMGHVARVNPTGIVFWRRERIQEESTPWSGG